MRVWRYLLLGGMLVLMALPALAQDVVQGRAVTVEDWQARIPLLIVIIVLVLAVDAVFLLPIFRKKSDQK